MRRLLRISAKGFTIVELLVVIAVIGILAAISIVAYNGITNQARDAAVLSDAESVAGEVVRYSVKHDGEYGSAVEWHSEGSANANIDFTPSSGNIVDIVANDDDYCIRVYHPDASIHSNLYLAASKESGDGVCDDLPPSSLAVSTNNGVGSNLLKVVDSSYDNINCALTMGGQVYCWGRGNAGELGNGVSSSSNVPVAVTTSGVLSGKTIKRIYTETQTSCAIASDGNAYCWGYGTSGQLGNGVSSSSNVPVAVTTSGVLAGKTIKKMSVGSGRVCAIASDNNAYCWGSNSIYGPLGDGTTTSSNVPVAVSTSGVLSGKTIVDIAVGNVGTTCVLASDGRVYCWGNGASGQLGNNSTATSTVPVAVSTSGVLSGKSISQMVMLDSGNTLCVRTSDGLPFCWGGGTAGRLGNNDSSNSSVPVAVTTSGVLSGKTVKSIMSGGGAVCAIASDNLPYCWGSGTAGQLGNGASSNSLVPVAVTASGALSGKTVKSLHGTYGSFLCAIASDDQAYCWGRGTSGELGNNTSVDSNVPVAVTTSGVLSGKTIRSLTVGYSMVCAVASDYDVYCWGAGTAGQLGNGSSSTVLVPTPVSNIGP